MIKYGVWFVGNAKEPASLCYEGRNIFIADKLMQAVDKMMNWNIILVIN